MKLVIPIICSFLLLGACASEQGHVATTQQSSLEVDHVWIRVSNGAPELSALIENGFVQHTSFTHTGMGTAATFIRFENIYLEFIWVEDAESLRQVSPEFAFTLSGDPGASPFGIGLRKMVSETAQLPFGVRSFSAEWMDPGAFTEVAAVSDNAPADPSVFAIRDNIRWDLRVEAQPELLDAVNHELGLREVTRIHIRGPGLPSNSPAVTALMELGIVEFSSAEDHLLELEFDGQSTTTLDLRPRLPLILQY